MSEINFKHYLENLQKTVEFGAKIAKISNAGDAILLYGEVGAGKTSFARGFIQAISETDEEITSPTFTLVQTYSLSSGKTPAKTLWHCDLYRLEHEHELIELGLDEAFDDGIVLIEWAELIEKQLPNALKIKFEINGQGRNIEISGSAEIWEEKLKDI